MGDAIETTAVGQPREGGDEGPEGQSSVTADGGGGRGFFSRIIGVLSPPEAEIAQLDAPRSFAPVLPVPGMLNLRRMRVEDVMIPKADITAVPVTIPMDELIEVFRESGLTRIPVFDGTLDTPIGLVNLKDFALKYCFVPERPDFSLREMLRPLLFVPPSMPLGVLLQKMQTERIHMALVIDEYGGTDGLVTIEDLIETVVGEIEDEHDVDEAQSFIREKPGVWLALARTPLESFEAAVGMDLTAHEEIDEEEVDSLGGLVSMLAGHVPARGEVVPHPAGVEFEVIDADPRRIKRLRIRLPGSLSARETVREA
ncbi:hemolysin family protein [Limimaricola pyoseonensis]|uniref:Magnesium and cobalt transporter n=1 Tax=Limimaricola pyoseonensis TaxID=521013 RepID=A0A1G7ID33_9RHOB|nr:hemolysin family protein [Limimaricola pyoseonensis]SDF10630.1 magnesium and cobalt transporter [Limimaricola pyoseonensis]